MTSVGLAICRRRRRRQLAAKRPAAIYGAFLLSTRGSHSLRGPRRPTGESLITLTGMLAVAPYFGTWAALLAVGGAMAAAARPNLRGPILFAATWITAFIATAVSENDTLANIVAVMQQEQVSDLSPVALATGFLLLLIIAATGALTLGSPQSRNPCSRGGRFYALTLEALLCGLATLDLMQACQEWSCGPQSSP